MFKETKDGQTHSMNDGCGDPHHNIPKIIHQIWVGPRPRPDHWMQTWKDKHPDWEYILWNEENIKGFENQKLIDYCMEHKLYHGVSDIVRYEILYRHGGFVAPADSECVNPIDELIDIEEDCFACYQGGTRHPKLISPHLATTKENILMRAMINALSEKRIVEIPWVETGNLLLTSMIKKLNYHLKIYPYYFFIPEYNDGTKYTGDGKIYAIHKWYTTKKLWKSE